jgi:hypothetical protein
MIVQDLRWWVVVVVVVMVIAEIGIGWVDWWLGVNTLWSFSFSSLDLSSVWFLQMNYIRFKCENIA